MNTQPNFSHILQSIQSDPFTKGEHLKHTHDMDPHNLELLIECLATEGIPLKTGQRFSIDQLKTRELKPWIANTQPKLKKAPTTWQDTVKALKHIVSTDELRPAMCAVYFHLENNSIIATDAHKLVAIRYHESIKEFTESTLINAKTGQQIDDRFPNYQAVIRETHQYEAVCNIEYLKNHAKACLNAAKVFTEDTPVLLVIDLPDGNQWIGNPKLLYDVCTALQTFGTHSAMIKFNGPTNYLMLETVTKTALVMPYRVENWEESTKKFIKYTCF